MTIVAFALALCSSARSGSDHDIVRTKPVGDLILQVWLDRTNGIIPSDRSIGYGWFTVTNKYIIVIPPKDEYLCRAQMFDSKGFAVSPRNSFTNLGKHFFDLKHPTTEQEWDAVKDVIRIRPAHGTQSAAPAVVFAGHENSEPRYLSCPDDLFDIKSAGRYTLKLQFQAYERIYKGGHTNVYRLERFDPVEFTVTKE